MFSYIRVHQSESKQIMAFLHSYHNLSSLFSFKAVVTSQAFFKNHRNISVAPTSLILFYFLILSCVFSSTQTLKVMSMPMLAGKRILITGGGRGIGRAMAHICASEGAQVAICSRNQTDLKETIATWQPSSDSNCSNGVSNDAVSPTIEMYVTDVTHEASVETMVKSIVNKWGGIDILINNAGRNQAFGKKNAYELKTSDFSDLLSLNIVAVHTVTSSVLRHSMLKNEASDRRIINVSSRAGKVGIPGMSFYVASKFALEGYSATLSEELKNDNIFVNTISPGMVDTYSFPKAPGKKGVRTAESVRDGLMLLLETKETGMYIHVDELDEVREKQMEDSVAMKPISEVKFSV